MHSREDSRGLLSLALAAMLVIAALAGARVGAAEQKTVALGNDLFIGGEDVIISQAVAGDMIVAGDYVQLQAPISGELVAAGRIVHLSSSAQQDAYIAGSEVTIAGPVERNARIAGGRIIIAAPARIQGNTSLAGGEIDISGPVAGYVQAMGGRIFINGPVGGDVRLTARQITLGPQASIDGTLRYRSEEDIEQHPSARVAGGIERLAESESDESGMGWFVAIWGIGLMILAAVLVAVLPGFTRRSSQAATHRFGLTMLVGVVTIVLVPLLLFLALISVVGIPLALALLLSYLLLLLFGFVMAGVAIADLALRRSPADKREKVAWRSLGAAIAVAVLTLVTLIPIVGGIIAMLALVIGIGAMVVQLRSPGGVATAGG